MRHILNSIILIAVTFSTTAFGQENRIPAKGMAMFSKETHFEYYEFTRHSVGDNDILIDIMYSGICHSDIHMGKANGGK